MLQTRHMNYEEPMVTSNVSRASRAVEGWLSTRARVSGDIGSPYGTRGIGAPVTEVILNDGSGHLYR